MPEEVRGFRGLRGQIQVSVYGMRICSHSSRDIDIVFKYSSGRPSRGSVHPVGPHGNRIPVLDSGNSLHDVPEEDDSFDEGVRTDHDVDRNNLNIVDSHVNLSVISSDWTAYLADCWISFRFSVLGFRMFFGPVSSAETIGQDANDFLVLQGSVWNDFLKNPLFDPDFNPKFPNDELQ